MLGRNELAWGWKPNTYKYWLMCVSLTTQRWTPPLQDDTRLPALTGVGLQCVTQALVRIGPAGAKVIYTGSIPWFRRNHAMAGLKDSRLYHLTTSISPLLGLVTCIFTGVDILTRTTGWEGMATICDLKWQLTSGLICMSNPSTDLHIYKNLT